MGSVSTLYPGMYITNSPSLTLRSGKVQRDCTVWANGCKVLPLSLYGGQGMYLPLVKGADTQMQYSTSFTILYLKDGYSPFHLQGVSCRPPSVMGTPLYYKL